MGIFKQMKDLKATTAAAPGPIDEAGQLAEQSRPLAGTLQSAEGMGSAATAQRALAAPARGPDFDPIAGVSLELYVEISKGLAAYNYDQSKAADVAASKGVSGSDWTMAVDGWNARLRANSSVGQRFNALYLAA